MKKVYSYPYVEIMSANEIDPSSIFFSLCMYTLTHLAGFGASKSGEARNPSERWPWALGRQKVSDFLFAKWARVRQNVPPASKLVGRYWGSARSLNRDW